jgi:hypothetical protein
MAAPPSPFPGGVPGGYPGVYQGGLPGGMAMPPGGTYPRRPDRMIDDLIAKWMASQNDSDRGKNEQELRATLTKQFQERLGVQEKEIEQLEARVKQLREKLELRRKHQDEIITFRIQQLFREAQGLGWGSEAGRDRAWWYSPNEPNYPAAGGKKRALRSLA